jgi:chitin-binding protein
VAYQGLVYEAKWWTRGKTPDTTDAFELISEVTLGYSDNTIYQGGDQARYQGKLFEAKWWTRGTAPSSAAPNNNGPWTLIGDADC